MMLSTHFDIEPFRCFIQRQYLFDFKSEFGKSSPCQVFGVSSYSGHVLTFQVLVEDKFIYSYVPVQALHNSEKDFTHLCLEDSNYFNCPSDKLVVHTFKSLHNKVCQIYNRNGDWQANGSYQMTFDWPNDNQLCHLIKTRNKFILWPSHKLIFSAEENLDLPGYKKLHLEWKL